MKNTVLIKKIALALVLCMLLSMMCACGNNNKVKNTNKFSAPDKVSIESTMVADNGKYAMYWDNDKKCVLLYEAETNSYWSSIPYSYYQETDPSGIGMVRMHSPIFIEYLSQQQIKTAYAHVEATMNGEVIAEITDDTLRVTYYMTDLEISIPVEYKLCNDGMETRLIISDICENENYVYSVSISPFMCSAKNNGNGSYLFIPSGSGTLMYVDEGGRNTRTYQELVYGTDYATTITEKITNTENIAMPVYGAKNGNEAICAIITEGAEFARINAEAGNEEYGYSAVWATFLLRGLNSLYVTDYQGNQSQISISTEDMIGADSAAVKYTPLSNDNANYMGIAEVYRDFLKSKASKQKSEKDFSTLYLKILGGTITKSNLFGFEQEELMVSTSYDSAEKIVTEISDSTAETPVIQMIGYGDRGVDVGEIAGGLSLSSNFGSFDDFIEYCNDEKIPYYFDFNVIEYNKSGLGVSKYGDAVTTVNNTIAKQYVFSKSSYNKLSNKDVFYIVKRNIIPDVVNKLAEFTNKNSLSGVSLSTLGNKSYSMYSDSSGYNKLGFISVFNDSIEKLRSNGNKIMTSYPFDYAAVASDCIVESPTKSSQYDGFDLDIPFYQIVMKGITPTAVSPINLSITPQEQFLKAMETGSSLSFSLCDTWNEDFSTSIQSVFQLSLYNTWKSTIEDMTNSSSAYLRNVKDAYISEHKQIVDNVYLTEFSNGTIVYTNYSDSDVVTDYGVIKANDFKYVLSGEQS